MATDLPFAAVVVAMFGLCFGSFVGVLVARAPSVEGVLRGRSRCDACGRILGAADLVPIASWLVRKGRCRACGARITPLWTFLEVATAGAFLLAWSVASDLWGAALLAPFLGVLIALTAIDLRLHRLPDAIVLPTSAMALALIVVADLAGGELQLAGALAGAAVSAGLLGTIYVAALRVYGHEGMGFGDVKLAGLIGLVVGAVDLGSVGIALGAAILVGGVVAIVALARGVGRSAAIPFGPMLAAGALIAVVAGPRLLDAYLGLYGS